MRPSERSLTRNRRCSLFPARDRYPLDERSDIPSLLIWHNHLQLPPARNLRTAVHALNWPPLHPSTFIANRHPSSGRPHCIHESQGSLEAKVVERSDTRKVEDHPRVITEDLSYLSHDHPRLANQIPKETCNTFT